MKRLILITIVASIFAVASLAQAATQTNNLGVSAQVAASCRISSVADIAFGAYDPTEANNNDAGTGNMVIRCVKNTNYQTYVTGARTMAGGGDNLTFEIYQEVGRSNVYPSANPGVAGVAADNSPITVNYYGRIPALQDVSVANYTATVVSTVEY